MARRIFLSFTAACCLFCLIALPPPPAQAGRRPGLQAAGGGSGGRRRLQLLLRVPEPHFDATEAAAAVEEQQQRGVRVTKARPGWSPATGTTAGSGVRPELRAVPGGPDPLHHHGGSPSIRRPEQDRTPRRSP